MKVVKTDVLIVGGGGAACRAALAASDQGVRVLMVLKHTIGHSGATTHKCCEMAGYVVPGCGDPEDSEEKYYDDIMDAALGMADPALVQILVENAGPRFEELRSWGVSPSIQNGKEVIMKGCYSRYRRGYTIPGHGEPIVLALLRQIEKRPIQRMEHSIVIDLICKEDRCCGALVLESGKKLCLIQAGAVVLATGGASQVFRQNLNPTDVSGDGYSLAYEHGAMLKNMEFMQAGVGFFQPIKSLFNTYLWAGFPKLTNVRGEKFLEKYLPDGVTEQAVMLQHCKHFPFSSRDISRYIEIGIQKELNAGGGDTHLCLPVHFEHFTQEYIDSLEYDADLKQLWPMVQAHFRESNVNLLRDPVGVTCVAQAVNGGIAIDTRAMSTIPGLFAAGETASGPHGADRLGGNMMGTCQVFGAIAGREAALFAQHNRCFTLDKDDIRHTEKMQSVLYADINSSRMIVQLQNAAQKNLFICRTQERLDRMQTEIDSEMQQVLTAAHRDTPNQENLRLYHLLNTAQLMTTAANRRKESRGSHYREDFPETNPRYAAPISLCKNDIHY